MTTFSSGKRIGKSLKCYVMISKNIKCDKGQALVETAIVLPVYMLFLLCFMQLVMVMHAKFVVEYASFCAARAGVINRGDSKYMQEAAAIAMSPLYSRVKSIKDVKTTSKKMKSDICSKKNCPKHPIRVYLTNSPSPVNKYKTAYSTFDLSQTEKVLKVKLEYDYPMKLPVANKILAAVFAGFIDNVSSLDAKFLGIHHIKKDEPTIPLNAVCAMRITTLSKVK